MTVNGISGAGSSMQTGSPVGVTQMDSVSKSIQTQIANAQKKLQELSSNEELSMEDKMKERQEIQQEINNLNQQLRQHRMEQRMEQQTKKVSMEDMLGGRREASAKTGQKSAGLSQTDMQAMVSADSSMKQARVQDHAAMQLEGKAGVLESEIRLDKGRGAAAEKKEEELTGLRARAQALEAAQVSALADAGKRMRAAAKAEDTTEAAGAMRGKTEEAQEKVSGQEENAENLTLEAVSVGVAQVQQTVYTPIDLLL